MSMMILIRRDLLLFLLILTVFQLENIICSVSEGRFEEGGGKQETQGKHLKKSGLGFRFKESKKILHFARKYQIRK